jgi:hypothetical protein
MTTATTVVISVIAVPAVSFALALALARRQRGYDSRSRFYAILLTELRSQVAIARAQYPSVGEIPTSPTPAEDLATLDASMALHATQRVRLLCAEFNRALKVFYGHTLQMEGLARARDRGLHPDLEESHRQEDAHLQRQLAALKWARECLQRIEQQLRHELHGRDNPMRSTKRLQEVIDRRIQEQHLPLNPLGLPTLPDEPQDPTT